MALLFDIFEVRMITQHDAARYFSLIETNRERLEDFFAGTVSKTQTLPDTELFISEAITKAGEKTYLPFVVVDLETQKIIGFIDVKNIDWNLPKAELGCFIDGGYSGKGISRQALRLVIAYLFDVLGFNKLFLRTHHANASARALAEKCGFEVEGIIRNDYKTTKGEIVDLVYYGLLKH